MTARQASSARGRVAPTEPASLFASIGAKIAKRLKQHAPWASETTIPRHPSRHILVGAGLAALVAPAAIHAAQAPSVPVSGYRCIVHSQRNVSMNEEPPVDGDARIFALSSLEPDGSQLTAQETTVAASTEAFTTHRIDAWTGRYAGTTFLTDHSAGEMYVIEAVGQCETTPNLEGAQVQSAKKRGAP